MSLTSGTRLGPYEITAPLGVGGMGEVYRATDTNLKRQVAIKVLPAAVAADADRLARFQREAEVLAALNHPHIAAIYGLEKTPECTALVMELVEGEDLSSHIARGPIACAEALPIARQIAEALEAAHEQGIIHRDLKPANIKVRADGTVKVLDFGLAKAMDPAGASSADAMNSPTLTVRATQMGMILGTAAYMAPEQARGKTVDRRADVWAFGVVLYEMLAGQRAFKGDDISETLASVLAREPDMAALPIDTPAPVRRLLAGCLEKDPAKRIRAIGDAMRRLTTDLADGTADATSMGQPVPSAPRSPWRLALPLAVAVGIVAAAATWVLKPAPATGRAPTAVHLTIPLPPGQEIADAPAISRDGRTVAYAARQGTEPAQLYLRDLNSFEARPVAGSSGARGAFFSPDGRWVAFFAQGKLQKVEVGGGTPIRLAEAPFTYGGTWSEDNTIIYTASLASGLLRIPASGGTPEALTRPDGAANGYGHVSPQALPGGRSVLFTIWGQSHGAAVLSLESRRWQTVLPGSGGAAIFDASRGSAGRLLVPVAATIRAAPFDAARPAGTSLDAALLSDVYHYDARGWLAVSDTGTVVYAPGNPGKRSLVWVDRDGAENRLEEAEGGYGGAILSPDGTKASVSAGGKTWTQDLQRGTRSPLDSAGTNYAGIWTRDGLRLVFASNRGGDWDLYTQPADGSRPAEVLLRRPYNQLPSSISADGTVIFSDMDPATGFDLWTLSPDGKTAPLRVTPFNERDGQVSPDGRWVAYASDESGQSEIYVQSYPAGANRAPVSSSGGGTPRWSRDGRELFYIHGNALVAVPVRADGSIGAPRRLFDTSNYWFSPVAGYHVAPDGQRFLMIRPAPGSEPRQLNVILNWADHSAWPSRAATR